MARLIPPLLIVYAISWIMALARPELAQLGWNNLLFGRFPAPGPGNYYVIVVLQFAVLAPLIYKFYRRSPISTVIAMLLIDAVFEAFCQNTGAMSGEYAFAYHSSSLRYFFAFALGLWISDDLILLSKRNRWILGGALVSGIYMFVHTRYGFQFPFVRPDQDTQNYIGYCYAALLILFGVRLLPGNPTGLLAHAGRASYHVFLFQMMFFGFPPVNLASYYIFPGRAGHLLTILLNAVICIGAGIAWFEIESRCRRKVAATSGARSS